MQFRRVLENIVNNSVRYNKPGTTLYFDVNAGTSTVSILLGDNGTGIPEEVGNRVFEPFVVGEESRSRQGSGLGLSVARRIVELHGGTLTLLRESKLKAAFYIVLPIGTE
jgi:signal transduction histidine kinase